MLGEPMQRMQIAERALAVLDVRLDLIARGPHMARVSLGELRFDEGAGMALEHVFAEAALKLGE
jgi:hypothetical protein